MKKSAVSALCIAIITGLCFPDSVLAGAYDNSTLGLKGMAMGAALTGVADDATAVYFNPAGLAFNEKDVCNGEVYAYYAPADFSYQEGPLTDDSDETFIIYGSFLAKASDHWAVGFGAYIPYAGGGTTYDNFRGTGFDMETYAGWFAF